MSQSPKRKPLLCTLAGERTDRPPWWLMRQAGRYLPEYRAIRSKAPDFLALCLAPKLAAEITLQPLRRFHMDAAILFSDILIVPYALGQALAYREGEGPKLEAIGRTTDLRRLDRAGMVPRFAPVFEAVQRVAGDLPGDAALIGFAGAPWTLATYMVEGGTSRDFRLVKSWAYGDPAGFGELIDTLVAATIEFLSGQIEAGVEAVQLFDSWAGVLCEKAFESWVVQPTKRIIDELRRRFPQHPVIGFPRGAGVLYERYMQETGIDAIGCDGQLPISFMTRLQKTAPVQGNLDPVMLLSGEQAAAEAVERLLSALGQGPYIFNLGHGVLPETPLEAVASLAQILSRPDRQRRR